MSPRSSPLPTRSPKPETRSPIPALPPTLHLALPKGRMHQGVVQVLADAGISVSTTRPRVSPGGLPPRRGDQGSQAAEHRRDAPHRLARRGVRRRRLGGGALSGRRAGAGPGLDPVRIVAAAPRSLVEGGWPPDRTVRVASEMENLARRWIASKNLRAEFVRSFGATEVLPPEDADCIIDVTASGATLEANALVIIDEVMRSSTRLYASRAAMADPAKRRAIENLAMLLQSVLEARKRVMLEVNVTAEDLAGVIAVLPCMRQPTISTLHGGAGFRRQGRRAA